MPVQVLQEADQRLVIETHASTLASLLVACGLVCAGVATVKFFAQPHATSSESFQGLIGVAVTSLLAFLVMFERSVFVFDRAQRQVQWQRRRSFSKKSGVIPFEKIQAIVTQRPLGDDGVPSRRITILTAGQELPLSIAYEPDTDELSLQLAERLQTFIGQPAQDPLLVNVRVALHHGNVVEAVRLLRQEKQLSLVEAKEYIAEVRRAAITGQDAT